MSARRVAWIAIASAVSFITRALLRALGVGR